MLIGQGGPGGAKEIGRRQGGPGVVASRRSGRRRVKEIRASSRREWTHSQLSQDTPCHPPITL